jgi:hypothetical protein
MRASSNWPAAMYVAATLAPDLILRVGRSAGHDVFEVLNRVGVSFLLARDASELIARVDLAVVDL